MNTIKHAVASVKEKVGGHKHDTHGSTAPADNTATHEPHAAGAAHPDPPTHGHAHTSKDPPGAPGLIETPAPGVVSSGVFAPGLATTIMPRI